MSHEKQLEGWPEPTWSTEDLLRSLSSWANSVTFITYEMDLGRPTQSVQWLHDVGRRIDRAVDLLRARIQEKQP